MDETANLKLPYILAAQSQKHVTHNEALRALDAIVQLAVIDKDLGTPPGSPAEGDRYIVGASPTGSWSGHATHVAAWQDGAWAFYVPAAGWLAWVSDESQSYLFAGGGWIPAPGGGGASLVPKGAWSNATTYATGDLVEHDGHAFLSNIDGNLANEPDTATPGSTGEWTYFSVLTGGGGGGGEGVESVNPVPLVGINATADTTDRLSVASPASLFSHEGAGHQLKINKDDAGDTASVVFQTDFSGRAEFGLVGDDNFHVKVSADGSVWREAIVIDRSTGAVSVSGLREALAANRTYYVRTDGSDSNTGLSNTSGGAFLTIDKAIQAAATLDLSIYNITISVGAGTFTGSNTLRSMTGAGSVAISGAGAGSTIISVTGGHCFAGQVSCSYTISNLTMQTTTSGSCINALNGCSVTLNSVAFGATAYYHVQLGYGGKVNTSGNYSISGGALYHVFNQQGAFSSAGRAVTLTGTPTFTGYVRTLFGGLSEFQAMTFSGSATGLRYDVLGNGVIYANGGGASYLPGNSAGTATTGGQYL
ncbi:DUF2793 domain-containing protein [Hyphomicrobium sp.]|uniref:DUF2793 domain-containing protein n=1 Tax=Hyphomicrobium sp. TaxID=82 RepID=UPI002FE39CFF